MSSQVSNAVIITERLAQCRTWGNQLVGRQILLVRLQAGIELDHYTDVFSQPLICLSGEFGHDTTQREKDGKEVRH